MGNYINNDRIIISSNAVFFIDWFGQVPERVRNKVDEKVPAIKRETKKTVKSHLKKHKAGSVGGIDKGIYKKSIAIKSLVNSPTHIKFTVGAEKGHYRLTHLLEHGHRIFVHGHFTGDRTREVPHIVYGQNYADEKVVKMYKTAMDYAISTNNNPNWKGNK